MIMRLFLASLACVRVIVLIKLGIPTPAIMPQITNTRTISIIVNAFLDILVSAYCGSCLIRAALQPVQENKAPAGTTETSMVYDPSDRTTETIGSVVLQDTVKFFGVRSTSRSAQSAVYAS